MTSVSSDVYSDGGITQFKSWLPQLPKSWGIAPFSGVGSIHARIGWRGLTADEYVEEGYAFLSTPDILQDEIDFEEVDRIPEWRYQESPDIQLQHGDVLLSKDGTLGVVRLLRALPEPATVNSSIAVLRTSSALEPQYLAWYLKSQPIQDFIGLRTSGATVPHLFQKDIKDFRIIIPPPDIQEKIAIFLDHQTVFIDRLIEKKQRLLKLLEEKREAVITRAVTKGLDTHVEMEDSGVEWIGKIPAHWDVCKLWHVAEVGNGSTPRRTEDRYWRQGTIPWVTSAAVNQDKIEEVEQYVTVEAIEECHLPLVSSGSVVIGIIGQGRTRGTSALLGIDATLSQNIAYVTPWQDSTQPKILNYIFEAAYEHMRDMSNQVGGAQGALSCGTLKQLDIPKIPTREQREIEIHVDEWISKIHTLASKTRQSIQLLREKRQTLITAAVTGQIDVSDWEPPDSGPEQPEAIHA